MGTTKSEENILRDKVITWGGNNIAPILKIHRVLNKYSDLNLYIYYGSLLLVLAKDPKDAVTVVKKHPDFEGSTGWQSKRFKPYRDQ